MQRDILIKNFLRILMITTLIIAVLFYCIDVFTNADFDNINELLIQKLIVSREGVFITIAAILIGIYFGIFTILLSLKTNSKIATMDYYIFKEILMFIGHAFLGAFIYLIYALVYPIILNYVVEGPFGFYKFCYETVLFLTVLYMILSALRVGLAYMSIFKEDIDKIFEDFKSESQTQNDYDKTMQDLKEFLRMEKYKKERKNIELVDKVAQETNAKKSRS